MEVSPEVPASEPGFDALLSRMAAREDPGTSFCIVFEGGSAEAHQQALGRLKEATGMALYQVALDTLFDERAESAQGNLREVFDTQGEVPSILCFEDADAFFRLDKRQSAREGLDPDALTPLTYLFDRIKAFKGITVLCLSSPAYVAEARPHADGIVLF